MKLNPKYEKAHYRIVKAMIEMGQYKRACVYLLNGFNEIGDNESKTVHLKALESEIK